MECYLVGGAVRDRLLGLPIRERDWVVIGSTPEAMLREGFKPVGKEFPVFLHPETKEEYALARTERNTGPGYKGFSVDSSPTVTLEQDLQRRDLTINAMAEAPDGTIIDPFGGQEHLGEGLLQHVSPAFAEDPVRILRVARFAARFARWGFHVAHSTNALMRGMVEGGEVDHLVPERVWAELFKALQEDQPSRFFEVLHGCGALARLLPELDRLFSPTPPHGRHTEQGSVPHPLAALQQAVRLSKEPRVRFAALIHELGNGQTPRGNGHEERDVQAIEALCQRYRIPNGFRDLAILAARYHRHCHRVTELQPTQILDILDALDAFRRLQRFEELLLTCKAAARAAEGMEDEPYPQAVFFQNAVRAASRVTAEPLLEQGLKGQSLGKRIRELRVEAIRTMA